MNIVKEFAATRGAKKVYIVDTIEGLRVVVEIDQKTNTHDWPTLNADGSIVYEHPDKIPQYLESLTAEAFDELAVLLAEQVKIVSFSEWLTDQRGRQDYVGELARGASADRAWPKSGRTYERFFNYLGLGIQSEGMQEALDQAWEEYQLFIAD